MAILLYLVMLGLHQVIGVDKIEAQVEISVSSEGIRGVLNLEQDSDDRPVHITGRLNGLSGNSRHGFHIHERGKRFLLMLILNLLLNNSIKLYRRCH